MSEQKNRAILAKKQEVVKDCIAVANSFEDALSLAQTLVLYWQHNEYDAELTEQDLLNFSFTKDELVTFMGMMQQLILFANGQPTTPGNWMSVNNQIKQP